HTPDHGCLGPINIVLGGKSLLAALELLPWPALSNILPLIRAGKITNHKKRDSGDAKGPLCQIILALAQRTQSRDGALDRKESYPQTNRSVVATKARHQEAERANRRFLRHPLTAEISFATLFKSSNHDIGILP
ncbi:MAG: hypothetical protein PF568_03780, partial [Deltaproteobacteria bacterium]|nr:hypothetical protein [Deltaproteobacteria bacterium]